MAYVRYINQNTKDSHQTSGAYMLSFLRYANRDTKNFSDADFVELRQPLIVVSDCINIQISSSKKSHIHQASMVLLGGDINYLTAIAPGDFVLINLLNSDEKLFGRNGSPNTATKDSLYARAKDLKPINKKTDGFKGIFKIQSVRENIKTMPNGTKTVFYQVTANAFTELNQVVYFNPYLFDSKETEGASAVLNSNSVQEWSQIVDKNQHNMSVIFKKLVGFLIGQGFPPNFIPQKEGVVRNFNRSFQIPPSAARLIGINKAQPLASDMFNYYVGIQQYSGSPNTTEELGLNPNFNREGNYLNTGSSPTGVSLIQPEPWAQVTAWSILQQYSNSLINEMYTSFKLTPEGNVMPCVVYRQKPFTSSFYKRKYPNVKVTDFLSLPRWKISNDLLLDISLGRDESARVNFVHIIGKTRFLDLRDYAANQSALNFQQQDIEDIKRNGLRPIISGCDFDFPSDNSKSSLSPIWNTLVFDWLNNGHLKTNGTIVSAGIEEPIAIGDNLQINNTVLHIETINHTMSISPEGFKEFRTTCQLSFGVDSRVDRANYSPIYPEMEHTDAYTYRKTDFDKGEKILPGFSDSQDIIGRQSGEEVTETDSPAFSRIPKTLEDAVSKIKTKRKK